MRALLLCVVLGCGGSSPQPSSSPAGPAGSGAPAATAGSGDQFTELMAKLTEFRDEMCHCLDVSCAKIVSDEMTGWAQSVAKRGDPKLTPDQTKAAAALGQQLGACLQKAGG